MGDKDPKSKVKEFITDVVEYFKTPPAPEPELNDVIGKTEQKGKFYIVPGYGKMSQKQFNAFFYSSNLVILGHKMRPFEKAVNRYNLEIRRLKSINIYSFSRSEMNDANRDTLERRIAIMLKNWELEYRNNSKSTDATKALNRIRTLQMQMIRTKSKGIGEIFSGTFDKYYYDITHLDRISRYDAANSTTSALTHKKVKFSGNANDLINFYENEIDFIEDTYLDDMNDRVKSNTYYLNKLKNI